MTQALLRVSGDLREQTIRRLLNAMQSESAVEIEREVEAVVNSLPMPVAIEADWARDDEDDKGPRIVVARHIDSASGVGAALSHLAALPHEPMLDLIFPRSDLESVGGADGVVSYIVARPAALRELAAALNAVADTAETRWAFAPRAAVAALLATKAAKPEANNGSR